MFTGLVESMGKVHEVEVQPPGVLLHIDTEALSADASLGDSIAINGCCLTVVKIQENILSFEAGAETLQRTNLGELAAGSSVNLERSLKVGDRMGGHFVTGHIDTTGRLIEIQKDPPWATLWFQVPPERTQQMAAKGSVAVDGVSLTLVDVLQDRFSVALIPHTLSVTTLGTLSAGDAVNIETDLLAKYVQAQLQGDSDPMNENRPA